MKSVFDNLKDILQIDIVPFFESYNLFVQSDLQNIIAYYKSDTNKTAIPSQSFKTLDSLIFESNQILDKFYNSTDRLNNCEQYDILDAFEDCFHKLQTYTNLSKWLQSNQQTTNVSTTYILNERETIESAARTIGYDDGDQGSIDIMLNNRTKEVDWNLNGGYYFQYNLLSTGSTLRLNAVVDNIVGDRVYGIDIDENFAFEDNDLKILSPRATFEQTCTRYLKLSINDNPEFPSDGMDKTLLVNRIVTLTNFPVMMRRLTNVINKDDTIKSFELQGIDYKDDALILEMNFYSQLSTLIRVSNEN